MVTTEDPRPFLSTQRFLPGAAGGELGMIDWREVQVLQGKREVGKGELGYFLLEFDICQVDLILI